MSENVPTNVQSNPWLYTSRNFLAEAFESWQAWILDPSYESAYRPAKERAERYLYFLQNSTALPRPRDNKDRKIKSQARKDWVLGEDGEILYRKGNPKKLVISEGVLKTLAYHHERHLHAGQDKLYRNIKKLFHGITKEECQEIVYKCRGCNLKAASTITAPFQPIVVDYPLERVQVDLLDYREAPSGPYHWILTIRDRFNKIICLFALRTKVAEEIALYFEFWIRCYHCPWIL